MFNVYDYEFCCFNNLLRKTCTAVFLYKEAVSQPRKPGSFTCARAPEPDQLLILHVKSMFGK